MRAWVLALALGPLGNVAAQSASSKSPTAPAVMSHAFGDTAAFGLRILSFDREAESATFSGKDTRHLVILAVVPGREIEVIVPGSGSFGKGPSRGVLQVSLQRTEELPPDADADARAQMAYERCVSQAEAAARRAEAAQRTRRDSTGRAMDPPRVSPNATLDAARHCERLAKDTPRGRRTRRLPPRTPTERYLVVLASSVALSDEQLQSRLASLTAVGSDVSTTIEAIAAGLFAGVTDTWSGAYTPW